jgi:hypothetical protein
MSLIYSSQDINHKRKSEKLFQDNELIQNELETGLCQQLDNKIEHSKFSSSYPHKNSEESSRSYLFL